MMCWLQMGIYQWWRVRHSLLRFSRGRDSGRGARVHRLIQWAIHNGASPVRTRFFAVVVVVVVGPRRMKGERGLLVS